MHCCSGDADATEGKTGTPSLAAHAPRRSLRAATRQGIQPALPGTPKAKVKQRAKKPLPGAAAQRESVAIEHPDPHSSEASWKLTALAHDPGVPDGAVQTSELQGSMLSQPGEALPDHKESSTAPGLLALTGVAVVDNEAAALARPTWHRNADAVSLSPIRNPPSSYAPVGKGQQSASAACVVVQAGDDTHSHSLTEAEHAIRSSTALQDSSEDSQTGTPRQELDQEAVALALNPEAHLVLQEMAALHHSAHTALQALADLQPRAHAVMLRTPQLTTTRPAAKAGKPDPSEFDQG